MKYNFFVFTPKGVNFCIAEQTIFMEIRELVTP
jgi:hypothetical protein